MQKIRMAVLALHQNKSEIISDLNWKLYQRLSESHQPYSWKGYFIDIAVSLLTIFVELFKNWKHSGLH